MTAGFTTFETRAELFRVEIAPNPENGLRIPCKIMIDKLAAVPKSKLGSRIGVLSDLEMARVNRAMLVFLGLAAGVSRREV